MKRVYYVQTNDYMTPVKVYLTEEMLAGVVETLKAISLGDEDSLVEICDEDGEVIYSNYNKWIKTHKE